MSLTNLTICIAVLQQLWQGRLHRTLPSLYDLYHSTPSEHRLIKAALGFPVGALLGIAFHFAVISRLKMVPEFMQFALSGLFLAVVTAGFALSGPVRCIVLLCVPTFAGKSGRSYIGTFAMAYLLSGPVANTVFNAKEMTRSVRCSTEVAANLTESRADLRLRPLANIMKDLMKQGSKIHETAAQVKKEFLPVEIEVEDGSEIEELKADNDYVDTITNTGKSRSDTIDERHSRKHPDTEGEKKGNEYGRKLDYRCEDVFSIGVKHCRKAFMDAEARCMERVGIAGYALCLPLKLTIMCELIKVAPSMMGIFCDSDTEVNEGFGDAYQTALNASNALFTNFEVNMQYKVVKADEDIDRVTADEVSKRIAYEFSSGVEWVNFTLDIIQTLLAFVFMRVIYGSYKYHRKYVLDFYHDNTYVTAYFRHIDKRRRKQGKRTLLPLKKIERKTMIFPTRYSMTGPEVKRMIKRTLKLTFEAFIYTLFILTDRFIYECMKIIARHSKIEFKQIVTLTPSGSHNITVEVDGKGIMGQIVRTILEGFNQKHSINNLASNAPCLPNPTKVPTESLVMIGTVFIILFILVVLDAYTMRLRRLTAALFYPKREKKRILILYNGMMKRRKGFLRHTRHKVQRKAWEQQLHVKTSMRTSLAHYFPRLCGWLGNRKCLICEEVESKKLSFVSCTAPGCKFVYCKECWADVNRNCYACRGAEEWSSMSTSD